MRHRIAFVLIGLVLTSGCSVQFAYNNLDRFARWQVADFVDLNAEQKAYFDQEVSHLLYWHRVTQLPEYAQRLEVFASRVDDGVVPDDLAALTADVEQWARNVERHGLPLATEILLSLSDEQVAELPENFARSNAELAEDELGKAVEESQEAWAERFERIMKPFTGRLSRTQKHYLANQSVHYIPEFEMWVAYRAQWQQALMELLQHRQNTGVFVRDFERLALSREQFVDADFREVEQRNRALALKTAAYLLARLDSDQKKRFAQRMRELIVDFRELAEDAGDAPAARTLCLVRCPPVFTPASTE